MHSSGCCLSTLSFLYTSASSSWYRFLFLPFTSLFFPDCCVSLIRYPFLFLLRLYGSNRFCGHLQQDCLGTFPEMVMRETLDGFQGGLQIGGRMITLCWWHHPVGHFRGRTTGVGGSPRQRQPTYLRRQDQGNGERRHSVPHTHSEWTNGAGGYVPVPWVPDHTLAR